MIVPEWFKLTCYMLAPVVPVWSDFFAKSTDYTLRGLAMPILASITAGVSVLLARTRTKQEPPPPPAT